MWGYDYEADECTIAHRPLHLLRIQDDGAVLLDTLDVEGEATRLTGAMATDSRLFAMVSDGGNYGWEDDDGAGVYVPPVDSLVVITGHGDDALEEAARVELQQTSWTSLLGASGDRAMYRSDRGLGFLDASDAEDPAVIIAPTLGWGCYDAVVTDDAVYCVLGEHGLQVVSLP